MLGMLGKCSFLNPVVASFRLALAISQPRSQILGGDSETNIALGVWAIGFDDFHPVFLNKQLAMPCLP